MDFWRFSRVHLGASGVYELAVGSFSFPTSNKSSRNPRFARRSFELAKATQSSYQWGRTLFLVARNDKPHASQSPRHVLPATQ